MVQLVLVLRWGSACLCLVWLSKVKVNWLAGKTTLSSDLRKASCLSGQQTVRKAFGPQITAQGRPGLSEVEKRKKAQAAALWPAGCHRGVLLHRGAGISLGWVGGTFQKWGQVPVGTAPCREGQGAQPRSADLKQHWEHTGRETLGFVIHWEGGALNLSTTLTRVSLRQKIVSENIKTGERKLIQD